MTPTKRLLIRDNNSGLSFLVDTGADISLIPASPSIRAKPAKLKLYAANNSLINTYGESMYTLDFGLRRAFSWNFCIADVKHPILGADFLTHFGLLIDLSKRRILDSSTNLCASAVYKKVSCDTVYSIAPDAANNNMYFKLLNSFPTLVGTQHAKSSITNLVQHEIITRGQPVFALPRRLAPDKYAAAKKEFEMLCERGICERATSPWASPIHMVKKKDGSWRICGDYRRLNAITEPDRYPIPYLLDCTNMLDGKCIFSSLDLLSAYNQIPMAPNDVNKTAVTTPFGSFVYKFMTFGLRNASQTFQRFVNQALGDLDFAFAYIDDILVASNSESEHREHLSTVFQRLEKAGLKLNVNKCIFGVPRIEFLGYTIDNQGIRPIAEKVKAISEFPKPKTVLELRRFLGMINFYRRNLPHAAETQAPLNAFLIDSRKNDKRQIPWDPASEEAFNKCKTDLANATCLVHPKYNAPIRLVSDASNFAVGAVLEQFSDSNCWEPLAFFSKKLSPAQTKYSAYDRELTAIYEAVKYFRSLVEGRDFSIITDHKPLTEAFNKSSDSAGPRRINQLSFISQFSTKILHVPGSENTVADSLSRIESIRLPTEISLGELAEQQRSDDELKQLLSNPNKSIALKKIIWGSDHHEIYCEISGESIRPFIPRSLTETVFKIFHEPAHPGAKASVRLIKQRYVWANMERDIKNLCKNCISCQQSKVHRHVINNPSHFVAPDGRFDHVHIDLIGPLPVSEGFSYCLTMIDRFSRWVEAIPIRDITAQTVARTFFDSWIARFGCPKVVTSDQGAQFESRLFLALCSLTGCERIRTTAYHPAANGLVERWHRTLKAAIMCHTRANWSQVLSTVLLGLRCHLRDDTDASPAEFLYGTSLRLPGEFFLHDDFTPDPQFFVEDFREHMRTVKPIPVVHKHKHNPFVFKDLFTCSHVFMRNMARKSLERPYSGPYKILNRMSDRVFELEINGSSRSVSTELLKPAYFIREDLINTNPPNTNVNTNVNNNSNNNSTNLLGNIPSTSQGTVPLKTYERPKKTVTFKV